MNRKRPPVGSFVIADYDSHTYLFNDRGNAIATLESASLSLVVADDPVFGKDMSKTSAGYVKVITSNGTLGWVFSNHVRVVEL